jgi:hypothetical protein
MYNVETGCRYLYAMKPSVAKCQLPKKQMKNIAPLTIPKHIFFFDDFGTGIDAVPSLPYIRCSISWSINPRFLPPNFERKIIRNIDMAANTATKAAIPTQPKTVFPFLNPSTAKDNENPRRPATNPLKSIVIAINTKIVSVRFCAYLRVHFGISLIFSLFCGT